MQNGEVKYERKVNLLSEDLPKRDSNTGYNEKTGTGRDYTQVSGWREATCK